MGLLPREEAGMYDLVYAGQELMKAKMLRYSGVTESIRRFETRFADIGLGTSATEFSHMTPEEHILRAARSFEKLVPDISQMSPEDLHEYSVLLNDAVTDLFDFHTYTNVAYGITRAVTQGAKSDEQLFGILGARPGDDARPGAGGN